MFEFFVDFCLKENKSVVCRHPEIYEKINDNEKNDISTSGKIISDLYEPI